MCGYIQKLLLKLMRSMPGIKLGMVGFDEDHIYMVISIPSKFSIATVMGQLKANQHLDCVKLSHGWRKCIEKTLYGRRATSLAE